MNRCKCVIRAADISLRNGKYTVTVADNVLSNLCACECVEIGLYTSIPIDSTCNTVEITDGTNTYEVYTVDPCCGGGCIADLWQTTLQCRTILVLRYAPASDSLTINDVRGRRKCGA